MLGPRHRRVPSHRLTQQQEADRENARTVTQAGAFAFDARLETGISYTVALVDPAMPCTLRNQSGVIAGADAAVELTCTVPALASVVVSGVAPAVTLAPDTTDYVVDLPLQQSAVTLTATVATAGDTLTIAGTDVASGAPSQAFALSLGDNPVDIVVENHVGWQRTYRLKLSAQHDKALAKERDAALFAAIRAKDTEAVRAALAAGANVNARKTVNGHPKLRPLHLVLLVGRLDIAELLLAAGAKIDGTDADECTPLHYACHSFRRPIDAEEVEFLLARGARVDARNAGNISPLFYAIQKGDLVIAERLIAVGADLGVVTTFGTLMSAAAQGHFEPERDSPFTRGEIFDFLRARGLGIEDPMHFDLASKTIVPSRGDSLLHIASRSANLGVVQRLIAAGVALNQPFDGKTPLAAARQKGYTAVADALAAAGAT
jgi:ankyrin repeat protein